MFFGARFDFCAFLGTFWCPFDANKVSLICCFGAIFGEVWMPLRCFFGAHFGAIFGAVLVPF